MSVILCFCDALCPVLRQWNAEKIADSNLVIPVTAIMLNELRSNAHHQFKVVTQYLDASVT